MTRAEQIEAGAREYVASNPDIWALFVRFADQAAKTRSHYSARTIFHRIRWHVEVETRGEDFKINNNYSAVFARWYHQIRPEHDGFFRTRDRTSEHA